MKSKHSMVNLQTVSQPGSSPPAMEPYSRGRKTVENGNCSEVFDFYEKSFSALTDYNPLKWQCRLFDAFINGDIPDVIDLPTGLGKTSVIPIWLIALAAQNNTAYTSHPRRLVYIVNRRTVVDQATTVVEKIRRRILNPDDPSWLEHSKVLSQLRCTLLKLSAGLDDMPLAISTLRGELADNEEWKSDPAKPSIIVGTIDMIGSKLLFSGYGDGRYHRPHHAGLIGQDALIVHDEAHLTPAFSKLLGSIAEVQQACDCRPIRVLELSATHPGNNRKVLSLKAEDETDEMVQERLNAKKRLAFTEVDDEHDLVKKMVEKATGYEMASSKVLIYVRSPESARKIGDALVKELGKGSDDRIRLLTGTLRGHERDRLVNENSVYLAFLNHDQKVQRTVYLVSTSAGEVGIDIDADHLVTDLTTLDSMIQRLGRVNRRGGEKRVAEVNILAQKATEEEGKEKKEKPWDKATKLTLALLCQLPKDDEAPNASPRNLRELLNSKDDKEKITAFAPTHPVIQLTDVMLDAWSLTSIMEPMSGRLDVAPFLHGLTFDLPETYVAWRKEVMLFEKSRVDEEALSDWFRACRIETRELLRDLTDRVKKTLKNLLKNHQKKNEDRDFPVILLDERGNAERSYLSKIVETTFPLAYRTVVLPVEAGGIKAEYGMLDSNAIPDETGKIDVAEIPTGKDGEVQRERWLFINSEESRRRERLLTGETRETPPENLHETESVAVQEAPEGMEGEAEERRLVLMEGTNRASPQSRKTSERTQTIRQHKDSARLYVGSITQALGLEPLLTEALVTAALRHDDGKARPIWQVFAGNSDMTNPVAKPIKTSHGRKLRGYRHEFGSLMEAPMDMSGHPEHDLILHLIAAHHGWARPHFKITAVDNTYTTEENERVAIEVLRRFGQLQLRFGRWGLAWLEALLRSADIAASKEPCGVSVEAFLEEVQA
jgi:CRISPR-associated endonuclease/helicase Cas3